MSDRELDSYLRWLSAQNLTLPQRVQRVARQTIGQPYRLFVLGEYPFELYDADPMVCLSASDCVTFVEQTYAMALSRDWPGFFKLLQRIRYKDGVVGIRTRNHFTEADWNTANAWLFEDVTANLPGVRTWPMKLTIDRKAFFVSFGVEYDGPLQIFEDRYIPKEEWPKAEAQLRDGDIIEIVRGEGESAFVSHMGLVLHAAAGWVTMIHSGKPAVREEPLGAYLTGHANVWGFKVLRARETGEPQPQW